MATTVNGRKWDFTSIELKVDNQVYPLTGSINYSDPREIGKVHGNSAKKRGRTRGTIDPSGDFEMLKEDGTAFLEYLTTTYGGYYEADFQITVTYGNNGQATTTDKLVDCTLVNADDAHSEGVDALTTKLEVDIIEIQRGSARAFASET